MHTAATVADHRRRIKRVMLHVDRHLDRPCRLEDLAGVARFSPFHRALEMLYPEAERVCQGPLAVTFLPPDWAAVLADREGLTALMSEANRPITPVFWFVHARVAPIQGSTA